MTTTWRCARCGYVTVQPGGPDRIVWHDHCRPPGKATRKTRLYPDPESDAA